MSLIEVVAQSQILPVSYVYQLYCIEKGKTTFSRPNYRISVMNTTVHDSCVVRNERSAPAFNLTISTANVFRRYKMIVNRKVRDSFLAYLSLTIFRSFFFV